MKEQSLVLPEESKERPVRDLNGIPFADPAYHARMKHLFPHQVMSHPDEVAVNLYLANFVKPIKTVSRQVSCFACGTVMIGPGVLGHKQTLEIDLSSNTLEARCKGCGWPVRTRHFMRGIRERAHLNLVVLDFFPMSYHPSVIESAKVQEEKLS